MNHYPARPAPRVIVIDGDKEFAEKIISSIENYFEKNSLTIKTDWTPSIERSLLQMKYFDYDLAVVGYRPADDESGLDLVEMLNEKKKKMPVIIVAGIEDQSSAEEAFRQGVADFFVKDEKSLALLPKSVDTNIIKYHSSLEYERLNSDLLEKNMEMKSVNETLARQSVRFLKLKQEHETARHKMESLLNAMTGGVLFINSGKEIGMINPAGRRIFRIDEDDTSFNLEDLSVFIGFNPFELDTEDEIPAVIFSREYMISTSIVEEEDTRKAGRMLFIYDVTKDREVERLKAEFQSMISHELRTPLTAIKGAVENFVRGNLGPITDQQKKFLTMISRNVERQTLLINDMLDLAKLEAKMMSLNVSRVDPEFIARLSYESFQYGFKEKGIAFSIKIDPSLPKITADERMISQILENLLSNALKFTPGGGSVKLEARKATGEKSGIDKTSEAITISVTDSGPGVPDDRKEKIFDRYYQLDSSAKRNFKGTGLGLSISRKLASLHNGTIRCADDAGGGAMFTLTLPVTMAARKKILIISGNPQETKVDEEILCKEFNPITLNTGEGADKAVAEILPHLVLLDYHVPGMDGFEIYSSMKKNDVTAHTPVIFVSGRMTEKEKIHAIKMGAADIVSRPYKAGEFLARIKRIVNRQ